MPRVQNSQQHVIVDSIGSELAAHIPPAMDGAIDGLTLDAFGQAVALLECQSTSGPERRGKDN